MSVSTDAIDATDPTLVAAEAFNAAAAAAAGATAPQAFLEDALAQLASLLGVSSCAILACGESGLRCLAAVGLPPEYLAASDSKHGSGSFLVAPPGSGGGMGALGPAIAWGERMLAHGFGSSWSVALTLPDGRAVGAFVAVERDPGPRAPRCSS